MSNREIVMGVLSRLPEDAPLADIAREIEFLDGVETAREQVRRGEILSADEMRESVKQWTTGQ